MKESLNSNLPERITAVRNMARRANIRGRVVEGINGAVSIPALVGFGITLAEDNKPAAIAYGLSALAMVVGAGATEVSRSTSQKMYQNNIEGMYLQEINSLRNQLEEEAER